MVTSTICAASLNVIRGADAERLKLAPLRGAAFHRTIMRMGLEMIFSARPTVEHDDPLRVSALRHGLWTLGIALAAQAFWTRDAEASASSDASASCYGFSEDVGV